VRKVDRHTWLTIGLGGIERITVRERGDSDVWPAVAERSDFGQHGQYEIGLFAPRIDFIAPSQSRFRSDMARHESRSGADKGFVAACANALGSKAGSYGIDARHDNVDAP